MQKSTLMRECFSVFGDKTWMDTGCRGRIRTGGLEVMSLAGFQTALLCRMPLPGHPFYAICTTEGLPVLSDGGGRSRIRTCTPPRFRAGDGRPHYAARVCFRHSSIFPAPLLQDGQKRGDVKKECGPRFHPASSHYLFYTISRCALGNFLW